MRVPSLDRLLKAFPSLDEQQAKLIRALGHAVDEGEPDHTYGLRANDKLEKLVDEHVPGTSKYVRSMHSDPYRMHMWRVTVALHAMNEVMGTYGVEALGPDVHGYNAPPYEYLNTGDTYATTLIYRRRDNSLNIGSWGDIVEHHRNW